MTTTGFHPITTVRIAGRVRVRRSRVSHAVRELEQLARVREAGLASRASPESSRAISAARSSPSSGARCDAVTAPSLSFTTTQVVGRERGDLREVGDDDHLRRSASRASRRPISIALAPPTPASTSSKTNVGTGRCRDDDLDREHHARELAAGCALRERARLGAGVRLQQDRRPGRARSGRARASVDLDD